MLPRVKSAVHDLSFLSPADRSLLPVLSDSYHLLMNTPDNADAPLLRPTGIDDETDETAQATDSMVQTQVPPASTDAPTPPPKPPVHVLEPLVYVAPFKL